MRRAVVDDGEQGGAEVVPGRRGLWVLRRHDADGAVVGEVLVALHQGAERFLQFLVEGRRGRGRTTVLLHLFGGAIEGAEPSLVFALRRDVGREVAGHEGHRQQGVLTGGAFELEQGPVFGVAVGLGALAGLARSFGQCLAVLEDIVPTDELGLLGVASHHLEHDGVVDAERGQDARDGGAEGDFDQPVVGGERAALEVHGSLLQLFLDRIGDFRELLGDVRLLGVRPSRRLAAESRGLEFGQGDLAAGTHLQKRAGGQGFERDDAAAALDGERADLTGIPGLGGAGLRRAQRQQGDEAGGGGGLGAALQEAEERDPEVDQQAEGHERHGDVGQEPTGVAHDLQDADVLAGGGVAEAGLVEGHAAVTERLVHRDVEGEGAAPGLDGHVAGEAAGNIGAGVLLVREAVEANAERQVGAGAAERELVFAAGVLERLSGEGLRQLGVKQPDADGLAVGDELQERARDVADVVVEAFGQALERQRRTGGDALRGGDVGAIGHLRLRAEHGVRVVELDLGLEGRAGERELRLGIGHRAEQRIGDGYDLLLAGIGAVDEGDLELAEGFGVGPAFAFGDDHRGFFLARGGDKPADQQQHEAAVNERDAGVADA